MKFSSNLKMLPLAAMMAAAFGAQAASTECVQTHTHAVYTSVAREGLAMHSGESVHVAVSLQVRDKAGLDTLSESVVAGRSRPITSTEFMSRFAPTQQHVDAVVSHLRKADCTNIEVAANNMLITADGSTGTARSAFQVEMKHFSMSGREALLPPPPMQSFRNRWAASF